MGAIVETRDTPASAPATRRPVRRVAFWGFLGMGLAFSVFGPALPGIRETFGLTLSQAGGLVIVNSGAYLVSVLLGGLAADRWGRRPLVLIGAVLLALGGIIFASAPALASALAGLALIGVGLGLADGALNALINEHSGAWRGADLNLTHGFFGLGAVIGPLAAGLLLSAGLTWRWLYVPGIVTALGLAWAAARLRLGRERVVEADPRAAWAALAAPAVWLLGLVLCLYVGVEMMVGTWAFSHLRAAFGADDAVAGIATALYWAGLTLGRFLMGTLGARLGAHLLIIGNVIASAIALGLLVVAPTLPLAIAALVLMGLALANIFPAVIAVGGEAYPQSVGAVAGALIAAGGLGGAIFPWLTGVIGERAGLGAALGGGVLLLAIMLAAELTVLVLQRRQCATNRIVEEAP